MHIFYLLLSIILFAITFNLRKKSEAVNDEHANNKLKQAAKAICGMTMH
ncbi:hypothetical protein R5Q06_00460 [Oenococcus oeni]|nr:protein BatD [Oenococcus oeni]MDI4584156.1 hypothetical protein [Oenococcus sp. UCMA 14587]QHW12466.1 protein BatD [Oenococcus sp. UCMA 16435]